MDKKRKQASHFGNNSDVMASSSMQNFENKREMACKLDKTMVFENHRKSLIQHCERSELRLHFEWTKVN